jgi:hypothetical protein
LRLTKEIIDALATERGGYTKATLTALDVKWDSVHHSGFKGWKRQLIGKAVTDEQYEQAVQGKTTYSIRG